jgi:hypothetical protein
VGWCLDDERPRDLFAERYHWRFEEAPSARGLSPDQTRAKMIAQVVKARDAAAADEVRAQADAMLDVLRSILLGPDLRIVRDGGPDFGMTGRRPGWWKLADHIDELAWVVWVRHRDVSAVPRPAPSPPRR